MLNWRERWYEGREVVKGCERKTGPEKEKEGLRRGKKILVGREVIR